MQGMRRGAKHAPTHTILTRLEPQGMGGTTLSVSDYAMLLTIDRTVIQYLVQCTTTSRHAVAALRIFEAVRKVFNAHLYVRRASSDEKKPTGVRMTVAELHTIGESLVIVLRRLLPFNGSWERPFVPRVLELLHRTVPMVQLRSSICEINFETFHQLSKWEQGLSWMYSRGTCPCNVSVPA